MLIVGGFVVVVTLLSSVRFVLLRARARHVESDPSLAVPDRVYRLQRMILRSQLVTFAILMAGGVFVAAAGTAAGLHEHSVTALAVLQAAGIVVLMQVVVARAVRPSMSRARGVALVAPHRARHALLLAVFIAVMTGAYLIAHLVVPSHGVAHAVGVPAVYLVLLLALQAVIAPVLMVAFRARALPADTHARLQSLARRLDVRVRDIRMFPGRAQHIANAATIGVFPGLRYVLVTDYLLDELTPEQVDAVVAHEFGHVKQHHLLTKLLSVVAVWAVLEALLLAVSSTSFALLVLPIAVAFPLGIALTNGIVGVRLERRADDVAARAVSPEALIGALDRVAELSHTKRDTGWIWSVATQHPGMDARTARLRARTAPPAPPSNRVH